MLSGSGDVLGCQISVMSEDCKVMDLSLPPEFPSNNFIMLHRKNDDYFEMNLAHLGKDDYYIISEVPVADLELSGEGEFYIKFHVKDKENNTVSYSSNKYSTQEQGAVISTESLDKSLTYTFPNPGILNFCSSFCKMNEATVTRTR